MNIFFKKLPLPILLIGLSLLLVLVCFIALSVGSVNIVGLQIYHIVTKGLFAPQPILATGQVALHDIIWLLRMPRIILAATVGAALSVCGVVMQAIVKNPLADPYILGISSGASLGATVAIMLGIGISFGENFIGLAAFLGALAVSGGVVALANIGGRSNSLKLLLSGMALSAVCSAFSGFIVYFANNKEGMQTITYWMMGSFAGAKWHNLAVITPLVIIATIFFITQSRIFNLMLLGDEAAITLGRELHSYRQLYLLISALLVGLAVYCSGMIGFVGLIIPHIVRMVVGTSHQKLIPISALTGAIFLVVADALCRIIIPRTELPIGILIAIIGAPSFVYLMVKRSYGFGGER